MILSARVAVGRLPRESPTGAHTSASPVPLRGPKQLGYLSKVSPQLRTTSASPLRAEVAGLPLQMETPQRHTTSELSPENPL